jgi:hypothetical protein
LSKSSKYLVGAEFANLKIGGPADGYRTSMAKCPPKVLRMLYRGGGARASSRFASDDVAAYIIERYGHETDNFSHKPRPPSFISQPNNASIRATLPLLVPAFPSRIEIATGVGSGRSLQIQTTSIG